MDLPLKECFGDPRGLGCISPVRIVERWEKEDLDNAKLLKKPTSMKARHNPSKHSILMDSEYGESHGDHYVENHTNQYGENTHSEQVGVSGATMYEASFSVGVQAGYGGNARPAQPNFASPIRYHGTPVSPNPNYGANPQFAPVPSPTTYPPNTVQGTVWSTGLFDCHEDETNAVMTTFLPCVTFGQIAEVMDQGEMTCPLGSFIYTLMMPALCSQWIMGSSYRTRLRQRYNLVEAPYTDTISHVFCPFCSLCQEFRELRTRGLDPSLGWNGILAQRQAAPHEAMNVPPPRHNMIP